MPLVLVAIPLELVVAFAILLMLWATVWIFQKPIAKLLSLIPVIGENAAGAVFAAGGWISDLAGQWAKVAIDPVVQVWNVGVNALQGFMGQVTATVETVWYSLAGDVVSLWTAATHLSVLADAAQAGITRLATLVGGQVAAVAGVVADVAYIVTHRLPALADELRSWAAARVASVVNAAVASLEAADRAIRALVAQAIDTYTTRLGQAIDGLRTWAGQLVGNAIAPLARGIDALRADLGTLGRSIDGRLSDVWRVLAPMIALDLARVVPQVIAQVTTMEQECVAPTCAAIKPRLDLLNTLSEGVMLAAMLELVNAAIHDPVGAAHAAADGAQELRTLTDDLVGPILGLQV